VIGRLLLLLSLAACGACSPDTAAVYPLEKGFPFPHPRVPFNAHTWIVDARALGADTTDAVETRCYGRCTPDERGRAEHAQRLVDALDTRTHWRAVCGDDVSADKIFAARGYFNVRSLGPDEHLITVWCDQGAYNNDQVVIHVEGDRTALLETDRYSYEVGGASYSSRGGSWSFGHVGDIDPVARTFTSRSHFTGPIGVWRRHRVEQGSAIRTIEIRSNAWEGQHPEAPETWPHAPFWTLP
jgi:hypothetical protein